MAVYKCKMCGGNLNIEEGASICTCEYCDTTQTVPKADDEKKVSLFARANRLRSSNEFDKAAGVYESIVAEFPEEAEAYWGLVLCKYGIEYVDDPATGKKIPTCHRSSFDSVMDDENFEQACENADAASRPIYRAEAKQIEELRKGIIEVSSKEDPYDIFICYKETDENGERTIDSVIAQDVYEALTQKGYRVFFARITLEDKLGQEYEPYIFAALNSAKVMLVFGTDYEYFNAVWVKNEWSRYLQLMAKGEKKSLIPCYKGIDAYDMPKEFAKLQAQDMGKIGAIQDLIRGIEKILGTAKVQKTVVQSSETETFIKRGYLALEDGEWNNAYGFFEKALNKDPENAQAYMGEFLVEAKNASFEKYIDGLIARYEHVNPEMRNACSEKTDLINKLVKDYTIQGYLHESRIRKELAYNRSLQYASTVSVVERNKKTVVNELTNNNHLTKARRFDEQNTGRKVKAEISRFEKAMDALIDKSIEDDNKVKESIAADYEYSFQKANERVVSLYEQAVSQRDADYDRCVSDFGKCKTEEDYSNVIPVLKSFHGYKDSNALLSKAQKTVNEMKAESERKKAEEERIRLEKEKKAEEDEKKRREREAKQKAAKEKKKKVNNKLKEVFSCILIPAINILFIYLMFWTRLFKDAIPEGHYPFKNDLKILQQVGIRAFFEGSLRYYSVQILVLVFCLIIGYCICYADMVSDFFVYSYYLTYILVVVKVFVGILAVAGTHSDTSHLVIKGIVFLVLDVIALNVFKFLPAKKK